MDKFTVSDLFFNSKEIDAINWDDLNESVKIQANEFLNNYPALQEVFTPSELAEDFLNRV